MGLCISGEWNHWIRNKEEEAEDGGSSQSRITDENREIILSVLFNPKSLWLCKKYMESEVTCKVSYRRT